MTHLTTTIVDLCNYITNNDDLANEGAWRLKPIESRRLENELKYRPEGGWSALVALLCGTGVLRATRNGFTLGPNAFPCWTKREATSKLLAAFTEKLVPPSVAAGLFISINLHPAWGLKVAHKLHLPQDAQVADRGGDEELFPKMIEKAVQDQILAVANRFVEKFLSSNGQRLDMLLNKYEDGAIFDKYTQDTYTELRRWQKTNNGVPVIVAGGTNSIAALTAKEIWEEVILPSRAASVEDGKIVVHPEFVK